MKYKLFLLSAACLAASCISIKMNRDLLEIRSTELEAEIGSHLSFENTNGDLEVREWDLDYIRVESSIYGDSSSGVPSDINILFDEHDGQLSAVVSYPSGISFYSVDLLVMIPEQMGYSINYTTTNGETLIIGDVTANVESTNGDIHVEVTSSHELKTTNGDIAALLSRQRDPLTIETTNGDVTVEMPETMGYTAETVNGDIVVDSVLMDDGVFVHGNCIASIGTTNGDITVTGISAHDH